MSKCHGGSKSPRLAFGLYSLCNMYTKLESIIYPTLRATWRLLKLLLIELSQPESGGCEEPSRAERICPSLRLSTAL